MRARAQVQAAEARRRLTLLGKTVEDANGISLSMRARQVGIPVTVLRQWYTSYQRGGLDALVPTVWPEIPESLWSLLEQRKASLGDLAGLTFPSTTPLL